MHRVGIAVKACLARRVLRGLIVRLPGNDLIINEFPGRGAHQRVVRVDMKVGVLLLQGLAQQRSGSLGERRCNVEQEGDQFVLMIVVLRGGA